MTHDFDVVVIGGGIHGAGVAQAVAAAGHSVLVLEQTGLAHGTSSRSSKLIHGGLRYLESAQFGLVRESLRERALLLRLAPSLVRLAPFHVPVYRSWRRSALAVRAGLLLYAALGGLKAANRFGTIPRRQWHLLDGLDTRDLVAVFRYQDGRTDDAALTAAVMRSALSLGAALRMPARFAAARLEADGCQVDFEDAGKISRCRCRVLVNTSGPWVDRVLDGIEPAVPREAVELVRGTHVLVPGTLAAGVYYLETPRDGRAIFAMPRPDGILIGTTENSYTGDPGAVIPPPEEQDYLLEAVARYFPALRLQRADVLSAFAGLRVLPRGPGRAFDRPRETLLGVDREQRPRLLTVYGGKLTTFRSTAMKVMHRIGASLPARTAKADTALLPLEPGAASREAA